jgi:hypothetical protein
MALPITIPYTFANATSSIPLSNLDSDFTTVVNAINGIGNGTNSLANVSITGGSIDNVAIGSTTTSTGKFTTVTATTGNITTINATTLNSATHRSDTSLTFQTNGTTTAMTIDASQNVGIGASPTQKLDVNGLGRMRFISGSGAGFYLDTTGNASRFFVGTDATSEGWRIYDTIGGANRIYLDSSGNVGIGTSSPSTYGQLVVSGGTTTAGSPIFALNNNSFAGSDGAIINFNRPSQTQPVNARISSQDDGYFAGNLLFWTKQTGATGNAITERMRIDSSGNVGIGTSSPGTKLQVVQSASSAEVARFENNGTDAYFIVNQTQSGTSTRPVLSLRKNNNSVLQISNDATTTTGITYYESFGASGTHAFYTNGSERMRIDSSGNVGIGFSSGVGTYGQLEVGGSTNPTMALRSSSASGTIFAMTAVGATEARINAISNVPLTMFTNNTERMRIDSSGNVGIGTTSPNASAILDAQSTTKGVRFPNMTTTQKNAISSPAAGLVVFDTTLSKLCVYSGAAWQTITSI